MSDDEMYYTDKATTEVLAKALSKQKQLTQKQEHTIVSLQQQVKSLSQQLQTCLIQQQQNQKSYHSNNNEGRTNDPIIASHSTMNTTTTTSPNATDKHKNFITMSLDVVNVQDFTCADTDNITGSRTAGGHLTIQKERIGRTASVATQKIIREISAHQRSTTTSTTTTTTTTTETTTDSNNTNTGIGSNSNSFDNILLITRRIQTMFEQPTKHMGYLQSKLFAIDIMKLCKIVCNLLEAYEPRVVYLSSPCYVFGDIHGNIEDLHFFSDNIWRLGMNLTAGNFLFLGDYVDRGMNCLETVAYLLALKQQLPNKVYLLRGNHETREVNSWEEYYGERSFARQCRTRFGDDLGYKVWDACNMVFDRLPLAAVIDQEIFCVHGGIPRPLSKDTTRIQDILTVPKVAGINPPYEHKSEKYQQVASDCIWSDPASERQERTTIDPITGFGESSRGGGVVCFGNKAVTDFLQEQGFSFILRAHEAHAEGVAVSKGARVFTIFSTSQDHNQGSEAMAGCILVDSKKLQVINRSPAYKNQYVHRFDSFSLAGLSTQEIKQRIELGFVKADQDRDQSDTFFLSVEEVSEAGEVGLEVWDDFDEVLNKDEFFETSNIGLDDDFMNIKRGESVFDKHRQSSIDLDSLAYYHATTTENPLLDLQPLMPEDSKCA